jgi:hypothetical protein
MIEPSRASWLAFLSLASAWAAAVAGLAVLPIAVAAFVIAPSVETPRLARLAGSLGLTFALAGIAYAAASAAVASGLRRGRPWARSGAFGLAFANLFVPPFGTAHGAYALWQLLASQPPDSADETSHDDD